MYRESTQLKRGFPISLLYRLESSLILVASQTRSSSTTASQAHLGNFNGPKRTDHGQLSLVLQPWWLDPTPRPTTPSRGVLANTPCKLRGVTAGHRDAGHIRRRVKISTVVMYGDSDKDDDMDDYSRWVESDGEMLVINWYCNLQYII